ncbi:MAG: hypothetical protein WBH44_03915 [Proteocatella sp.]
MNEDYQSYKEYKSNSSGTYKKINKSKTENKKVKPKNNKARPQDKSAAKSKRSKSTNLNKKTSRGYLQSSNLKSDRAKKRLNQEREKEIKEKKKIEKQERKAQIWHAIKSNKKIFLVACFVVFYIGVSMGILYNNSNISELQYQMNSFKKDITKEKNLLNELEAERESTYKSETIENLAKYRLNMVYPTKNQIVYIKVD